MSKGVIGGVIGATIGFFAGGNVVAGWNIGYGIGSTYDVTKLPGLGDASAVEAGEGGPRFRVYGAFRPIGGQTIAVGPEVESRVRERSKGGSPVESSRALRTYAIGFGEGPAQFLRIWKDTVLVYDARVNPDIPWAESLRWAENVAFYTGDFDQVPDPSLQEALGTNEVHAHRGTIYFVKKLEDYTDRGRRIASYQAEIFRGSARVVTSLPYMAYSPEGMRTSAGSPQPVLQRTLFEEDFEASVGYIGAELRNQTVNAEPSPEDFDAAGSYVGFELRETRIVAEPSLEPFTSAPSYIDSELKVIRINHDNPPEEFRTSVSYIGSTLE